MHAITIIQLFYKIKHSLNINIAIEYHIVYHEWEKALRCEFHVDDRFNLFAYLIFRFFFVKIAEIYFLY